jgi:hypothetical protein
MEVCDIENLGKFRHGAPKYWCKTHFAFANAHDERLPEKCSKHDQPKICEDDKYTLNPFDWQGGVGVWGSLDPVYNTSPHQGHALGIHLHTREDEKGEKQIDYTFRELEIITPERDLFGKERTITINTEIAHAYTASTVFGKKLKYLKCPHCQNGHIDAGYYAVTYHKKHMCTFCGRDFIDGEKGISNPVVELQRIFKSSEGQRVIEKVKNVLDIKQKEFPGGIQIWGSNPAIIWTANRDEHAGIHVHVFKDTEGHEAFEDETFGRVIIDNIELDSEQVRCLMVQQSLGHLQGKVHSLYCPQCKKPHFDQGELGATIHESHVCEYCQTKFVSSIKCVSNPLIESLQKLQENYYALQK